MFVRSDTGARLAGLNPNDSRPAFCEPRRRPRTKLRERAGLG